MHKRKTLPTPIPSFPSPLQKQSLSKTLLSNNTNIINTLTPDPIPPSSSPPVSSSISSFPLLLTEDLPEGNDSSLNTLLHQITQNLHFEDILSNPSLPIKTQSSTHLSNHLTFSSYQYDSSLLTNITLEITIPSSNPSQLTNFLSRLNSFLSDNSNFTYYEYSNTKNMNFFALSNIDQLQYECYYKDNFSELFRMKSMKNKLDLLNKLKRITYITALTSLYKTFYETSNEFYILTSLHAYYFNNKNNNPTKTKEDHNIMNKGILLTNTISFYKRLEEYNIIPIYMDIKNTHNDNNENINNSPAFIKYEDMTLFYNIFIEDNNNNNFNIISPFHFEESIYRKCKYNIKHFTQNTSTTITVNISGCIFQKQLSKIITFLHNKQKRSHIELTYTMKLTRIPTTNPFYITNSLLSKTPSKVEYINNEFHFK